MKTIKNNRGFTLIELLTVIGIIALIAALTVPVINTAVRNGVINSTVSATQLKQDIAMARDKSVETRLDTYVIFDTANYTTDTNVDGINLTTNLQPFQSYCVIQFGHVGDQPGVHQYHQLTDWQQLPSGVFVVPSVLTGNGPFVLSSWSSDWNKDKNSIIPLPWLNLTNVAFPMIGFGGGHLIMEQTNYLYDITNRTFDIPYYVWVTSTNNAYVPIVAGNQYTHDINPDTTNGAYDVLEVGRNDGFVTVEQRKVH